jgi:hypothetical protein
MQAEVVQHIHNLLAAAKELSKVVESCDVQQSGANRQEMQTGLVYVLPDWCRIGSCSAQWIN